MAINALRFPAFRRRVLRLKGLKGPLPIACVALLLLSIALVWFISSASRPVDASLQAAVDGEALKLTSQAKVDLVRRLGVDATRIAVLGIEPTEFPDGSLGAPLPNRAYPLAVTPGYNIRLLVDGVVYRYWAAEGRIVYVESFVEPPTR